MSEGKTPKPVDRERLARTLGFQFPGVDFTAFFRRDDIYVVYSRKTRRVSYVHLGDRHLFSLRTSDGRYQPTFAGGLLLLELGLEKQRITVAPDAVPFVADGKSLYTRHVMTADSGIAPGSEVLLLSPEGELLAVGTSVHPTHALHSLVNGVAVKVKHSLNKHRKRTGS